MAKRDCAAVDEKVGHVDTALTSQDTAELRKARGAFFTPEPISRFIAQWALRSERDRVLEPSAGDAEFMIAATHRLVDLAGGGNAPLVEGVEIHAASAEIGRARVLAAGGSAKIAVGDFFQVPVDPTFDAVIGNPPYIRYQDFAGDARSAARRAALAAGVALSGLASSWAAFTVQSARFLREGGRLGLVLPAELLSVNYAAPVRKFLFDSFADVQLILFEKQVFPEAEADVVLLLADGYGLGPTDQASFRLAENAESLANLEGEALAWRPASADAKWTGSLVSARATQTLTRLAEHGVFSPLEDWGDTTLGIVTGNNKYFALPPERVRELDLMPDEIVPLSPPGSSHLRSLEITARDLQVLGEKGRSTYLFCPPVDHSRQAEGYIRAGEKTGVHDGYKCRVRRVWYRPPLLPPADLLLTYMNADTVRLATNAAGAHHLNSVHGVYLKEALQNLGRELLPLASLNSVTMLHAELVGRAYGGGVLKVEPREADRWLVPSPATVRENASALASIKGEVRALLSDGRLIEAANRVDRVLFGHDADTSDWLSSVEVARELFASRRQTRGASGRK